MHGIPCQICFDSSINAFGLDFGNKEVLAKMVKHWIPIRLFFECSAEATFALQRVSLQVWEPACVTYMMADSVIR